jgi:hypothetical protein
MLQLSVSSQNELWLRSPTLSLDPLFLISLSLSLSSTVHCSPYNDGLLTTAQVLSILAVFLSWGTFLTLILGIVSFLCLQIVWW